MRTLYHIPDTVVLTLSSEGAVDKEGRVSLLICALMHDLCLPFCHPIRDVLDFLGLPPTQLHWHSWCLLLCSCVAFRMVLEPRGEMYPNLTAREFLSFYFVKGLPSNIYSFLVRTQHLAKFESCHSNSKQWQKKFFLISGHGWEYLAFEMAIQDFPI